jgi:hypothetical protein
LCLHWGKSSHNALTGKQIFTHYVMAAGMKDLTTTSILKKDPTSRKKFVKLQKSHKILKRGK